MDFILALIFVAVGLFFINLFFELIDNKGKGKIKRAFVDIYRFDKAGWAKLIIWGGLVFLIMAMITG